MPGGEFDRDRHSTSDQYDSQGNQYPGQGGSHDQEEARYEEHSGENHDDNGDPQDEHGYPEENANDYGASGPDDGYAAAEGYGEEGNGDGQAEPEEGDRDGQQSGDDPAADGGESEYGDSGARDDSDADGFRGGEYHTEADSDRAMDADDEQALLELDPEPELTDEELYPEWHAASRKARLFSVLEPLTTEHMEQPFWWHMSTIAYHVVYLVVLISNMSMLFLDTFQDAPVPQSVRLTVKIVSNIFMASDLIARVVLFTSWSYVPLMVVDFVTLVCAVILLAVGGDAAKLPIYEIVYFPPLRAQRIFLHTGLYCRTETFRDINLAIRTMIDSLRSLIIFVVLMIISLLLFATFIYLAERGDFVSTEQLWFNDCHPYLSVCQGTVRSAFQSIPDALWFVIQSLTTVGYGDIVPTSMLGRLVAGAAVLMGVFVIAFPSMVLIGSLGQTRREFFAMQERDMLIRRYKALGDQAEDPAAATRNSGAASLAGTTRTLNNTKTLNQTRNEKAVKVREKTNLAADVMRAAQERVKNLFENKEAEKRQQNTTHAEAYFSFMGHNAREVFRSARSLHYEYDPICAVLCDPVDTLPVLASVTRVSPDRITAVMTLVLDDGRAQQLASDALVDIGVNSSDAVARARSVFGLDVAITHVSGLRLRRRADIGEARDRSVPLVIEIDASSSEDPVAAASRARVVVARGALRVRFSRSPATCWSWHKTIPVSSAMLASTPFLANLRKSSVKMAAVETWKEGPAKANPTAEANVQRNVVFIARKHLPSLVFPLFQEILTRAFTIRNANEFTDAVAMMVLLHCRQMRKMEVPPQHASAIHREAEVASYEKVFEIDVDYFRINDWSMGTAVVEFSERRSKSVRDIAIGDGGKCEQPRLDDIVAFKRSELPSHLLKIAGSEENGGFAPPNFEG